MIEANNPSVDVEELMQRVRAEAARLRSGRALDDARSERWNVNSNRLNEILDRQNSIALALDTAEFRNQPRTQIPPRLARLEAVGERPVRLLLRVVNYLFKQQREVDAAQNAALREMSALVVAAAQDLSNLTKRVAELQQRLDEREGKTDRTP